MKNNLGRTSMLSFAAALLIGAPHLAQGQAGGGTLPGEYMGGAALVFRKPNNPVSSRSGGGRLPVA